MKIKRGALKGLIEAAIGPSEASKSGLALTYKKLGSDTIYAIYDPKKLLFWCIEGVKDGDSPVDSLEKNGTSSMVGVIATEEDKSKNGPCNNGVVVSNSAAKKGHGPLIYDFVLSMGKPVTPDRNAVSQEAQKVWSRYMKDRKDVEKIPLDDNSLPLEKRRTPETSDDCNFYTDNEKEEDLNKKPYEPKDPRNYSYYIPGTNPEYSGMFSNDKKAFKEYNNVIRSMGLKEISESEWAEHVCYAAADYFNIKYALGVTHTKSPQNIDQPRSKGTIVQ